jgi:hypothetical protein
MRPLAIVLAALAAATGCSREHEASLPEACTSPSALTAALRAAPGPVRVDGTPISECLAKDSSPGSVVTLGAALLETAQRLGEEQDASGLGYLVGAVRRGAEGSQGIHSEIVRRLEQEAGSLSASAAFEAGERAGRSSG